MNDFSVFLNAYTGSFNVATEPYSDIPSTDLNAIKIYTDNGIAQLFETCELKTLVGQTMYTDNSAHIKLEDQSDVLTINVQYSFFFPTGTINTIGSIYNGYNDAGYQLPGTVQIFNIVGGVGQFLNAKGNVLAETFENNLLKFSFVFE